jgi:hypothetical protein
MTSFFYVFSIVFYTCVPVSQKCMHSSRKKKLAESAATHAPPAALLRRTWKTCLPLALWAVQRHESHWGQGLLSTADVEETPRTDLVFPQQLNGQYGAERCHVGAKRLYSGIHIVCTWLQDAGDSLGDLHTLHWSQCSPWACSAPKLPLIHPRRQSA